MHCKRQYGVIPYIKNGDKIKVVLITSKTNSFWIFPKGNLVKKKDEFSSAAQEAWEEAGLKGQVNKNQGYHFSYKLHGNKHKLTLFPMLVESILDEWPEKKERKRKVISIKKALNLIKIEAFSSSLQSFADDHGFKP